MCHPWDIANAIFSVKLSIKWLKALKTKQKENQCWNEGRSSTAVAEDLRPMATATVAEVKDIPTAEGLIGSFLFFFQNEG